MLIYIDIEILKWIIKNSLLSFCFFPVKIHLGHFPGQCLFSCLVMSYSL